MIEKEVKSDIVKQIIIVRTVTRTSNLKIEGKKISQISSDEGWAEIGGILTSKGTYSLTLKLISEENWGSYIGV